MRKISIKREQSQAGLSFAEREKFRPQVKNKLLLLLALLLTAATGAWADTSIVGPEDNLNDGYYSGDHKKNYSLEPGKTIKIEFTVSTATDDQLEGDVWNPWYAWAVKFWDGTLNAITIEPRNYGWEANTDNTRWTENWVKSWEINYPEDWESGYNFRDNMLQGATVVTTIKRDGADVIIIYDITTTSKEKYRQYVVKTYGDGTKTIWFDLIVDHCHITIDNDKTVTTDTENVTVTPAGYTVTMKDGVKDAGKWTVKVGEGQAQALPIGGLKGDGSETVTLQYNGRLKVKGVKATSEAGAPAAPIEVLTYSFDDDSHPSGLTAGSRVSFDYSRTSVITNSKFLNACNNTNGDPGATTVSLGDTDLSGETWTLSFEWAACGGCNSKPDHTTLKAGDATLFDLSGNSNWNTTVTIIYTGSDGSKTLPVPGCDKSNRFTAAVGDQYNTTTYWHHIVVTGSAEGVKMTITNSSTGAAVVEDVVLSETNVNPTSLIIEPCCGGGIGIDALSLTYEPTAAPAKEPATVTTAPTGAAIVGVGKTTALVSGGVADGGTLWYAVTTTNTKPASTDGFSDAVPTAQSITASGKVYVWYYVKGDDTHSDSEIAATAIEVPVADIVWDATNASGLEVWGTEEYEVDGVKLSGNSDMVAAAWSDGIVFEMYASGSFTFTAPTGKKFTKIEMNAKGPEQWDMVNLGDGWTFNVDWGTNMFIGTWKGSAASTVGLLTGADEFGGAATVSYIAFYLSE